MDDLNDVRQALGTMGHRLAAMDERLTELSALADKLTGIADSCDRMVGQLPGILRQLAHDPMYGALIGGPALQMADAIEKATAHRSISA